MAIKHRFFPNRNGYRSKPGAILCMLRYQCVKVYKNKKKNIWWSLYSMHVIRVLSWFFMTRGCPTTRSSTQFYVMIIPIYDIQFKVNICVYDCNNTNIMYTSRVLFLSWKKNKPRVVLVNKPKSQTTLIITEWLSFNMIHTTVVYWKRANHVS